MTAIHASTRLAALPQFDLFSVPSTQLLVDRDAITEHMPLATVSSSTPVMFQYVTSEDEYVLLNESKLYMKLRIKLKKISTATATIGVEQTVAKEEWNNIKPAKYLLHSLFKQIELTYNGKELTHSPATYAYRAYFEGLLGYSPDAKEGFLDGPRWNDTVFEPLENDPKTVELDLIGPIHTDLTFQQRALLGRAVVDIKLIPNDPSFYLQITTQPSNTRYEIAVEFINPTLYIHRAKTTKLLLDGHSQGFKTATSAKYPVSRVEVKPMIVQNGESTVHLATVINGQLPRRIIFGFVDLNGFNGSYSHNPYKFENLGLKHLIAKIDGTQYPAQAFKPDFGKKLVAREFDHIYSILNQNFNDPIVKMSKEQFINSPLFGFNFTPDLSSGAVTSGHVNLIKRGNLRLEMFFEPALTKAIAVIIFCEYDSIIEIDETRNVLTDYN